MNQCRSYTLDSSNDQYTNEIISPISSDFQNKEFKSFLGAQLGEMKIHNRSYGNFDSVMRILDFGVWFMSLIYNLSSHR